MVEPLKTLSAPNGVPLPIYRDSLLHEISENNLGDLSEYLKKEEAKKLYQPIGDYATKENGVVPYDQLPPDIRDEPDLTPYLKKTDAENTYQHKGDYLTEADIDNCVKYTDLKNPISRVSADGVLDWLKKNVDSDISGEHDRKYEIIADAINNGYRVKPEITYIKNDYIEIQLPDHEAKIRMGSGFVIEALMASDLTTINIGLFLFEGDEFTIFPTRYQDQVHTFQGDGKWIYNGDGNYSVKIPRALFSVNNSNIESFIFIDKEYQEKENGNKESVKYLEYTLNKGLAGGYCPLNGYSKIDDKYLPDGLDPELIKSLVTDEITLTREMKNQIIEAQRKTRINLLLDELDESKNIINLYFPHRLAHGSVFGVYMDYEGTVHHKYIFIIRKYYNGIADSKVIDDDTHTVIVCEFPDLDENGRYKYQINCSNANFKFAKVHNAIVSGCWCYTLAGHDVIPVGCMALADKALSNPMGIYGGNTWEKFCELEQVNIWLRTA